VGLLGDDDTATRIAADAVLRGSEVVVADRGDGVLRGIAIALARGFVTPLEAEQARARVKVSPDLDGFDRAGLVLVADGEPLDRLAAVVRPRCVVAVRGTYPAWFPHPRRLVGLRFPSSSAAELVRGPRTDSDTLAAVAAWLKPFGFRATVAPATGVSARAA
jgi:hypothetical protein